MQTMEAVRLVIWDLDETFWRGTLTEGGIREYVPEHHNIVIELAKRGIISSICSKNTHADVEKILTEKGIWDYFILPSIDWTPKAPRLKALIDDVQLRPETVLFIDDNPSNRAEAAALIKGLQIADETIIPTLLTHELLKGKDDAGLTRLKQYQLLQRRKQDEKAATSNIDFLRSSNIRVSIEPNVSAHLDRAIELINRTNQLNFTKVRLPDDESAKEKLNKIISQYFAQAGLVRVRDDYGDYGFCGLYISHSIHDVRRLVHFCFSCRILGMGIERWLYQKLGAPQINISGEVLTNLNDESTIDWINQHVDGALIYEGEEEVSASLPKKKNRFPEIRLRGGCELDALSHYLRQDASVMYTDTNYVDGGFLVRRDTTSDMVLSLSPLDEQIKAELSLLGLKVTDYEDKLFASAPPGTLFVISTWGDLYLPTYRHKTLDFTVTKALRLPGLHNLTNVTPEQLENYLPRVTLSDEGKNEIRRVVQHLSEHYVFAGRPTKQLLRTYWEKIFASVPSDCSLAVLLPNTNRGGDSIFAKVYHAAAQSVAREFPRVMTVDITPYIDPNEATKDGAVDHLDRMAYFKAYKHLLQVFGGEQKEVPPLSSLVINPL